LVNLLEIVLQRWRIHNAGGYLLWIHNHNDNRNNDRLNKKGEIMIKIEYDQIMKRYNVTVPFTLADETSRVTVASISEDNRLTMHRELRIDLVRQILMQWDEDEYQMTLDDVLNNKQKGDK